jgi:hypothetical protein
MLESSGELPTSTSVAAAPKFLAEMSCIRLTSRIRGSETIVLVRRMLNTYTISLLQRKITFCKDRLAAMSQLNAYTRVSDTVVTVCAQDTERVH